MMCLAFPFDSRVPTSGSEHPGAELVRWAWCDGFMLLLSELVREKNNFFAQTAAR